MAIEDEMMMEEAMMGERPPMPSMEGANMPRQDLLEGMPPEARGALMEPDEEIEIVLVSRLATLSPEELAMLDNAISPEVGAILDRVGDGKLALAALMFFIMLLLARCSNGGSLITINKTEINMLWDQSLELTHSDQSREPDVEQADSKDLSAETGSGSSSIHSEVTPKKSHSPQPSPKKPSKP